MRLLGSTEKENLTKFEVTEVELLDCNVFNNNYQKTSKVLFTFVPNKAFGQLINISLHALTMLQTLNSEFLFT